MLDRLGAAHDAIIGHSVGAAVTAMALAKRPALGRAVLIAPPASLTDSSRRITAALQWPEALQPLLVIHDRHDREAPLGEGLRYLRRWPQARLMETRGWAIARVAVIALKHASHPARLEAGLYSYGRCA